MPEEPVTEHQPIRRRLVLTEANKRSMHEPEGAKQHAKEMRVWAADWEDTAAAGPGLWPGVKGSRSGGDQQQQEEHGTQHPPPDVYWLEVRGGCRAPFSSQTACPDTWPAWPRCHCCAVPLFTSCLPACH